MTAISQQVRNGVLAVIADQHRQHQRAAALPVVGGDAVNLGGGAKIHLVGPLRLRLDYRVFNLQGTPRYETYHRFYVGANLRF